MIPQESSPSACQLPRTPEPFLPFHSRQRCCAPGLLSAAFSSGSASHRSKIMPWVRAYKTSCSRSDAAPVEPSPGLSSCPRNTICGGICTLLRSRSNRLSCRHISPLSRACTAAAQLVTFLRACSQWLCYDQHQLPTCYAQPLTSFRLSHRRSLTCHFTTRRSTNIRLPTLRSHPGSPSITLYLSTRSSL